MEARAAGGTASVPEEPAGVRIGDVWIPGRTALAPLAGVTDRSFRLLCRELGASLAVTEMVSAQGLAEGHERSSRFLDFDSDEHPIAVQVYGSEPETMAEGARVAAERRPDLIDVNCGCPVRKIVSRNAGAALLKDPARLERIVSSMARAVDVPVTVKIRSGWEDDESAADVARRVEAAGAAAIAVHGRTRTAGFEGMADWSVIRKVKESVTIPVIGNGDVRGPAEAKRMMETTGCDMVMMGRWAIGDPWIFMRAQRYLEEGVLAAEPDAVEVLDTAIRHLRASVAYKGLPSGVREMRRHLTAYFRRIPEGRRHRTDVLTEEDPEVVEAILRRMRNALQADGPPQSVSPEAA